MTLTHGADAARLRQIAAQLTQSGQQATKAGAEGTARAGVLSGAWHGSDLDHFDREWVLAQRSIESAAERLTRMAALMHEQADQQDAASEGGGGQAGAVLPTHPAPAGPTGPAPTGPPSGPGDSTFDEDIRGTEGQPVDKDLWQIAFHAQGEEHLLHEVPIVGYEQPPLPEGYTAADPAELGLDPDDFGPDSRPQAYLVETPDGGYVVAFQGSVEGEDWATNVSQAMGQDDEQYRLAMELGARVNEATDGDVTFTGHSLGGGFASAAAMATGQPAVTFDASGVHENTAAAAAEIRGDGATAESVATEAGQGQMRSYRMNTDILTNTQESTGLPDAPGTPITLDTPPSLGRTVSVAGGAAGGAVVGGVLGLFDGNLLDAGQDVAEGAAVGAGVGDGVWGHHWDPMTEAMDERYPD